jgi:amino acid transporter
MRKIKYTINEVVPTGMGVVFVITGVFTAIKSAIADSFIGIVASYLVMAIGFILIATMYVIAKNNKEDTPIETNKYKDE